MKDAFSTVAGIVKGAAEDAVRGSRRILQAGAKGLRVIASRFPGATARKKAPTGAGSWTAPSAPSTATPQRPPANEPARRESPGPSRMSAAPSKADAAKKSASVKKSAPMKKSAPAADPAAKKAIPAKTSPAKKAGAAKKAIPAKTSPAKKAGAAKKAAKAAPPTPDDAPADSGVGSDPQAPTP